MTTVSDILESAVAQVANSVYLRATDVQANTDVSNIVLAGKVFCVFSNLPEYDTVGEFNQTYEIPVEIQLLRLAKVDASTVHGDVIREVLRLDAETIYSSATNHEDVSLSFFTDDMSITHDEEVKLYGTVLTGLTLKFNMFIDLDKWC